MGLIDTLLGNLNPPQSRREAMRQIEGTPSYTTENDTPISGNGHWILNFHSTKPWNKWTPLNLVIIDNQSTNDIEALVNQNDDQAVSVVGNNSKTIQNEGIYDLKIVNQEPTNIDGGDIEVTFTRRPINTERQLVKNKRTLLNLG